MVFNIVIAYLQCKPQVIVSGQALFYVYLWDCYFKRDTDADQSHTHQALIDLNLQAVAEDDDVLIMRYVCSALSIRVAQIVSACKLSFINN